MNLELCYSFADMEQRLEKVHRTERIEYPPNKRLARMRFLANLLDNSILLPGGYRIGLDPLIGLAPAIGDFVGAGLSLWIVWEAALLGLPKRALGRMLGNVIIDALVGTVPGIGDILDATWKANARNMRIVDIEYMPTLKPRSPAAIILFFAIFFLAMTASWFALLVAVFNWIAKWFQ